MKFIKIYKLYLRPSHWHYYYGNENDEEENQINSNDEMVIN